MDAQPRRCERGVPAVVALISLLTGLSAAAAQPAGAAGGPRVTDRTHGLSFVLPAGWHQVSLSPLSLGDLIGSHAPLSSSLRESLATEAAHQRSHGVIVFAISSTRDEGGSFPNLNVSLEKGITATTKQLETGLTAGLERAGATSVSTRAVRYRYGPAVVGTYTERDASSATGTIYGVQVYVTHGANLFIMTLTSGNRATIGRAATTVSSTLRFT